MPSGFISTTAAPAPSPKRMHVLRSVQSTIRLIASAPTTSASGRGDAASRQCAVCSAYTKPVQAAFMSKQTVSPDSPSALCSAQAVLGMRLSGVIVATMQTPMSSARTPERESAMRAASMASCVCVSPSHTCRRRMPVRETIHASDVSMRAARSSFVTTCAGAQCPAPRSSKPLIRTPPVASDRCAGISPCAVSPAPDR